MNAKEIVEAYLTEHGYDGLCTYECGCFVGDLMPCGNSPEQCKPGYKQPCNDECPPADCSGYHIGPEMPPDVIKSISTQMRGFIRVKE